MLESNGWLTEYLPEIIAAVLYITIAWIIISGIRRDRRK